MMKLDLLAPDLGLEPGLELFFVDQSTYSAWLTGDSVSIVLEELDLVLAGWDGWQFLDKFEVLDLVVNVLKLLL